MLLFGIGGTTTFLFQEATMVSTLGKEWDTVGSRMQYLPEKLGGELSLKETFTTIRDVMDITGVGGVEVEA